MSIFFFINMPSALTLLNGFKFYHNLALSNMQRILIFFTLFFFYIFGSFNYKFC